MTEMLMVTRELTEVTLPDGSKAWFESQKAANSFASLTGKVRELFKDREALLGGFEKGAANPKPKPPKKEAAAKVEKAEKKPVNKPITAKKATTPPLNGKEAEKTERKTSDSHGSTESKPNNARVYVFAERTCGVCGNKFTPRSGRQKVCDTCRKQVWKTCKSTDGGSGSGSAVGDGNGDGGAAAEDAKPEPVTKRRGRPSKNKGVISDALAEVRKLAKDAGLGPYNTERCKEGSENE